MLEYDRIDISEEIDVNKTSLSKECDISHQWYFKDIDFNKNIRELWLDVAQSFSLQFFLRQVRWSVTPIDFMYN